MDATLNALAQILLQALPTFFLVLFLHFYLNAVFFKPLAAVLAKRAEETTGARKRAADSLDRAAAKAAAYEESLRNARGEVYKQQEEARRGWKEEQAAELASMRQRTEAMVRSTREQIARETEQARQELAGNTSMLADEIAKTLLERRSA